MKHILSFSLLVLTLPLFLSAQDTQPKELQYEFLTYEASYKDMPGKLVRGSTLGRGVAAVGDLDGDGVSEIAVGNPHETQASVYILFLTREGTLKSFSRISAKTDEGNLDLSEKGEFGIRIEALGDWDEDGIPDIAVGEPRGKIGSLPYGKVWILLLNADGTLKDKILLSGRTQGLNQKLGRGQLFGMDISAVGDLNGDGTKDLVVGAPELDSKGTGSIWMLFMASPHQISEAIQYRPDLRKGDRFGISVEYIGDLNEDGVGDLAVGAAGDDEAGLNKGAIYILLLKKGGKVKKERKIIEKKLGLEAKLEVDDRFGYSLAVLQDSLNNGPVRLAVGSERDDDGGKDKGALYVIDLQIDAKIAAQHKISELSLNFNGLLTPHYRWGSSINPVGDWNGDGNMDLLVNGDKSGKYGGFWILMPNQ